MYVCLCMGLTDSDLAEAIRNGSKTIGELMQNTGAGKGCSMCYEQLESLIIAENKCTYGRSTGIPLAVIKAF